MVSERVKVHLESEVHEGILVPSEDDKFVVVKLGNGYNIGVKKSRVKKVEKLGAVKISKAKKGKSKKDSKKKNLTILHTGGTIASKVDYTTGGVTGQFDPEEILSMFPELKKIANFDSRLIRNIMSENMRFDHYNLLSKEIEKETKKGVDGIIVTQGTDTMHIMSAALSFALEGLQIPVVIVGSQRSSDRPSTDSYLNLMSASVFIVNTNFKGVCVCMHENTNDDNCIVMHGCKVRKMHTSRRDAFRPINAPPIALVNYEKKKVGEIGSFENQEGPLKLKLFDPKLKVGYYKTHPHMYGEELKPFENFDGLLLEVFALGQAPILAQDSFMKENLNVAKMVKKIAGKIPVAVASQCVYGRVDMNVYSEGRELQKLGVIGNYHDMTPETAFVKLAWLLSNHKKADIPKLFSSNLRGEISSKTVNNSFLV